MNRAVSVAVVCLVLQASMPVIAGSQDNESDKPVRNGFTFEFAYGVMSAWQLMYDEGGGDSAVIPYPAHLAICLGFFVTNEVSLVLRLSTAVFPVVNEDDTYALPELGFTGPNVQVWISDRIFIGGGLGLAIHGPGEQDGVTTNLRAGYSFANYENHSFSVSIELFGRFFDELTTTGQVLHLGYQWF